MSEVARRLAVRSGTLSWWRWYLRSERAEPAAGRQRRKLVEKTEFLPVVVSPPVLAERAGAVEIDAGNARVRVEVGVDVNYVAALVRALRTTC